MNAFSDARLSVELSRLAAAHGPGPSGEAPPADASPDTEQVLAAVMSFHDLVRISTDLQGQAVRAAHDAGVSWANIGKLLGISRQAVQQRFDPSYVPGYIPGNVPGNVPGGGHGGFQEAKVPDGTSGEAPAAGTTRILGPVTRAEEVHHLTEACSQGWRLIRSLHGEHVLERDGRPWEVKRVSVFSARPMPSAGDGWHAAATRFPDCFYIRPLQVEGP